MIVNVTMPQVAFCVGVLILITSLIVGKKTKNEDIGIMCIIIGIFSVISFVPSLMFLMHEPARQAHTMKLAELPEKWQKFYNFAEKIRNDKLRIMALDKFLDNDPPMLTVENYNTLIGTDLYVPQRNSINYTLKANDDITKLIVLDYDFVSEE